MNHIEFYNLSAEMRLLLADLEDCGGELTPEVEARLTALGADTDAGVAEMALACRELERIEQALEQEERRLGARKRVKRSAGQTLRDRITDHMAQTGTLRVRTDLVTVSLVEGAESVRWVGKEDRIPDAYRKTFVEHRIDKEAVLRDRAEDIPLPEDIRIEKSRHIRIT